MEIGNEEVETEMFVMHCTVHLYTTSRKYIACVLLKKEERRLRTSEKEREIAMLLRQSQTSRRVKDRAAEIEQERERPDQTKCVGQRESVTCNIKEYKEARRQRMSAHQSHRSSTDADDQREARLHRLKIINDHERLLQREAMPQRESQSQKRLVAETEGQRDVRLEITERGSYRDQCTDVL